MGIVFLKRNRDAVKWNWLLMALLCWGIPLPVPCQNVLFYDDFSGTLANWNESGNAGTPQIVDGQLQLEMGYGLNWYVTQSPFDFGSKAYQVDMTFAGGGFQSSSNVKIINMQPLLGATNPDGENGAVRVQFSYQSYSMSRQVLDTNGEPAWQAIQLSENTSVANSVKAGSRIKIVVDADGVNGSYYVDGELLDLFQYAGDPLEGGFGFRSVVQRNLIVDDVRFYQLNADGSENVILEDSFDREELGSEWVNETLAADSTPGALQAKIQEGALYIENDGTNDTWLRTAKQSAFTGSATVFEFTFVDYLGSVVYNPSVVVGTKPYVSGQTSGVLLFDNGAGFNYAMESGSWTSGRVLGKRSVQNGMRFKVVVDPGAQSGKTYRNGIEVARFKTLGPALEGGFAFRSIVDRDATIDDLRIYTLDEDGTETTIFEDNFNRTELGSDWIVESITPGGLVEALVAEVFDEDVDGDNELYLDHDETLEDNWCRLTRDIPYGEKTVVIEGTYSYMTNGYPSVVIGTEKWVENETVGPLLLDNIDSVYGMDTRGGNVWVQNGPIAGTKVSLVVNADGRSGSLLTNDVLVSEWRMADEEAAIPVGAVGFNDPYTTLQVNVSPGTGNAVMIYDDVRVTELGTTLVNDWMIHE